MEKLDVVMAVVADMDKRLQRLEVLQGLIETPEEFGITEERIIQIMEEEGIPWEVAEKKLITNYGQEDK